MCSGTGGPALCRHMRCYAAGGACLISHVDWLISSLLLVVALKHRIAEMIYITSASYIPWTYAGLAVFAVPSGQDNNTDFVLMMFDRCRR
jgi:hypothetical protein